MYGRDIHLKTIKEGELFGELSLLYNIPRSANIRAKRKSVIFRLDRKTFYIVFHNKNTKKRDIYSKAIANVDFFQELDGHEKDQLQDIIKEMKVHPNQYVIREGRIGNKFYMVERGQLVALKKNDNGNETVVFEYNQGDYFGELALINNKSRAASVVAIVLIFIHIDS